MTSAAAPERWLFGPGRDLLFGCGLWYLLFFGALLALGPEIRVGQPAFLAPLLVLLVSTPHYGATLVRVYEQREERRAYAFFTVWTTLALLVLFVIGVEQTAFGTLLFTAYLTWSPWHYTGQNYGIAMMFVRRRGIEPGPALRRWLYATFILSYALTFFVMHRADGTTRGLAEGGVHLARLGIPDAIAGVAIPALALAYAVALVGAGAQLLRRGRPRDLLPVAMLAVSQALWFTVPDLARYWDAAGGVEALDFDHRAVYFNWVVLAHAAQYLWVTTYYARASSKWSGTTRYLGKTLLAGNVAWLLPALVFAPQLLGGRSSETDVALVVAALVNLHHFILDGAIWKLRRTRVGDVLIRSQSADRVERAPAVDARRRVAPGALFWSVAGVLLAIALVDFAIREIAIPRRAEAGDLDGARSLMDGLAWMGRDSATLRAALGQALAEQGRYEEALESVLHGAALTPSADAFGMAAQLQLAQGSPQRAAESAARAAALAPDRADVLTLAGAMSARAGNAAAARRYFKRALAIDAGWEPARRGLESLGD